MHNHIHHYYNVAVSSLIFLLGCAPTSVQTLTEYNNPLTRPTLVTVQNFAVSPDEVKLDSGVAGKVEDLTRGSPRTAQERALGAAAREAFAKDITAQLQKMNIPATRGSHLSPDGPTLVIQGQFVSIDEGNMAEREVIGFGLGRTSVKTYIQVYEVSPRSRILVASYETDAKSGYKPGLAVSLGAGAVADKLAASAIVGGSLAVVSETFLSTVNADADRTAKDFANKIKQLYRYQGWWLN